MFSHRRKRGIRRTFHPFGVFNTESTKITKKKWAGPQREPQIAPVRRIPQIQNHWRICEIGRIGEIRGFRPFLRALRDLRVSRGNESPFRDFSGFCGENAPWRYAILGSLDPVFLVCAAVSGLAGLLVVSNRNPVYSALSLMVCFLAFAVIFLRLGAAFLAAMHVLVYTGAILVLFLFVIMLLSLKPEEMGSEYPRWLKGVLALLCVALFGAIAIPISKSDLVATSIPEGYGSVEAVGNSLFTEFALPFELVSVLIIVAMLGCVVLAKRKS